MSIAYWAGPPKSYTKGRAGYGVQYIVVHSTEGGEGPNSAEDGHAYDTVRPDGTSTHVFVDPNSVAREVWDQDQAHAARAHGNKIGLQMELCGTASQTRDQWLDGNSYAILQNAAKMAAEWCVLHGIPVRRLSVNECRAAYFNSPSTRPKGFVAHADVTAAYPEDGGSHTDPGAHFPWDIFFKLVNQELAGGDDDMPKYLIETTEDGGQDLQVVATNGVSYWAVTDFNRITQVFGEPFPTIRVKTSELKNGFGIDMRQLAANAQTGASPGGGGVSADEVREIVTDVVDTQLDQAFSGGVDEND